jgi:hypothetical protein
VPTSRPRRGQGIPPRLHTSPSARDFELRQVGTTKAFLSSLFASGGLAQAFENAREGCNKVRTSGSRTIPSSTFSRATEKLRRRLWWSDQFKQWTAPIPGHAHLRRSAPPSG